MSHITIRVGETYPLKFDEGVKEAVVKEIKETHDFTFITVETDGFMPHVLSRFDFRKALEAADPEKYTSYPTETKI